MNRDQDEAFNAYGATWVVHVSYPAAAMLRTNERLSIGTYGQGKGGHSDRIDDHVYVENVYEFESIADTRDFIASATKLMSCIEQKDSIGKRYTIRVTVQTDPRKTNLEGRIGPRT